MEQDLENWPIVDGRYKVGNKKSPVAVCTNATVEGIELDMNKVAICGKCVTENIGIEKIIQNVVSNFYIRFLILCGKVSKGHFVEQAIISLKNEGIDKDKRIIGAKGNMPYLKGIDEGLIERFRYQVETVNLEGETNSEKIMRIVENCLQRSPGMYKGEKIELEKIEEIESTGPFQWIPDPKGFFVISLNKTKNNLLLEYFTKEGKLTKKIVGSCAEDICYKIAQLDLIGDFEQTIEHAMYLGRELQKAEIALKNNLDFEQNTDIIIKKVVEKKEEPVSINNFGWFD